jgi:hypothetical protein
MGTDRHQADSDKGVSEDKRTDHLLSTSSAGTAGAWLLPFRSCSLFLVGSDSLNGHLEVRGGSMIAGLVSDRALDVYNLECVKDQTAVVALRVRHPSDRVEYGFFNI